jgi:hypothetical protein
MPAKHEIQPAPGVAAIAQESTDRHCWRLSYPRYLSAIELLPPEKTTSAVVCFGFPTPDVGSRKPVTPETLRAAPDRPQESDS